MMILFPMLVWSKLDVAEIEAYLTHDEEIFKPIFKLIKGSSRSHSTVYNWKDFGTALRLMYNEGVAGMKFYLGDPNADPKKRAAAAKVAIAAFLAQSMQETIQYDACDENNWTDQNEVRKYGRPGEAYPIDAACGQAEQVYADYKCPLGFEGLECPQMPKGTVMFATTHAKWYGAPAPLFCAPDSHVKKAAGNRGHKSGRWSTVGWCDLKKSLSVDLSTPPYLREKCAVYEGQEGGFFTYGPFADKYRSVEGCCWWGRGVIQTTGRGNFGLLNHYLGKGHTHTNNNGNIPKRPSSPLYKDIDFCANPQFICSGDKPELKWIAGLFYWVQSVQAYEETIDGSGWNYYAEVNRFAECGRGTTEFIDAVSAIVNRGCHVPGKCKAGKVHGKNERRKYFLAVLAALDTQIPAGGTPAGNPGDGKCGSAPSPGTPSPGTPSPGTPSPSQGTPASSPGTPTPGTPASSPGTPTPGTPASDDDGMQAWLIALIVMVVVVVLLLGAFAMYKYNSSSTNGASPPQEVASFKQKSNSATTQHKPLQKRRHSGRNQSLRNGHAKGFESNPSKRK